MAPSRKWLDNPIAVLKGTSDDDGETVSALVVLAASHYDTSAHTLHFKVTCAYTSSMTRGKAWLGFTQEKAALITFLKSLHIERWSCPESHQCAQDFEKQTDHVTVPPVVTLPPVHMVVHLSSPGVLVRKSHTLQAPKYPRLKLPCRPSSCSPCLPRRCRRRAARPAASSTMSPTALPRLCVIRLRSKAPASRTWACLLTTTPCMRSSPRPLRPATTTNSGRTPSLAVEPPCSAARQQDNVPGTILAAFCYSAVPCRAGTLERLPVMRLPRQQWEGVSQTLVFVPGLLVHSRYDSLFLCPGVHVLPSVLVL